MPEVPEVIITIQYLNKKLKNKKITDIIVIGGRYQHQELQGIDLLKNNFFIFKKADSKGKFIWFELKDKNNKDIFLMNTLGMTGLWTFDENKNNRIQFNIESKTNLSIYFSDPRNFGTIVLSDDKKILNQRIDKLSPDVLKSNITTIQLLQMITQYIAKQRKKTNMNIVKILMNQNAIVSGIGNYLVAEILYDAKISPFRNLNELLPAELKTLSHSIRKISKYAYTDNITNYMSNFENFIKSNTNKINNNKFPDYHPDINVNNKFKFNVYQQEKDSKNNIVKRDVIIKGRTIHWVPAIQI